MNDEKLILNKKIKIFEDFYNHCKNENSINETLLKEYLCDILTWIEICIKHIDVKKMTAIEKKKISGIRYANNKKKHSVSLYKFNLNVYNLYSSKNLFPSNNIFPSNFGIFWNELEFEIEETKCQFINYNKYFKNKDILESFKDIVKIIENN